MPLFFGQEKALYKLDAAARRVIEGQNLNILLKGKTGQGKTTLADIFLSYISTSKIEEERIIRIIPNKDVQFPHLFEGKRYIFIDEIHTMTDPEWIYPYLDQHNHTFIACTNESGKLKEPLANRFSEIQLEPYSDQELIGIVNQNLPYRLDDTLALRIVKVGKRLPRTIIENICSWIKILSDQPPSSIEELESILESIGYSNGLNAQERDYLDFLHRTGGKASLSLLCSGLHLVPETILRDIEPGLVMDQRIAITPKGRILLC